MSIGTENTGNLVHELCEHVDSVINVFTEGCGKCCGFTGILTNVSCDAIKLITRDSCCFGPFAARFGTVTIIPIDEITAVTFCNTTF